MTAQAVDISVEEIAQQKPVLAHLTELSETVRDKALEMKKAIDQRDDAIREAIDLYRCSQRQVARATALSVGRVHGILAND